MFTIADVNQIYPNIANPKTVQAISSLLNNDTTTLIRNNWAMHTHRFRSRKFYDSAAGYAPISFFDANANEVNESIAQGRIPTGILFVAQGLEVSVSANLNSNNQYAANGSRIRDNNVSPVLQASIRDAFLEGSMFNLQAQGRDIILKDLGLHKFAPGGRRIGGFVSTTAAGTTAGGADVAGADSPNEFFRIPPMVLAENDEIKSTIVPVNLNTAYAAWITVSIVGTRFYNRAANAG